MTSQRVIVPDAVMYDLNKAILSGEKKFICPLCGDELNCSIQHGFDMEGNPVQSAKAHCIKCPFVLR